VFSRHNQNVHGRLRIEIREGVAEIVLVNCFRRNTPVDYLAEDATHVKESTDVRQQLSWLETGVRGSLAVNESRLYLRLGSPRASKSRCMANASLRLKDRIDANGTSMRRCLPDLSITCATRFLWSRSMTTKSPGEPATPTT